MSRHQKFDQKFVEINTEDRAVFPVIYNYIYNFNKKGIVRKKGDAYFGVPVKALGTKSFYAYGHNKPISKIIDFSKIKKKT